MLKLCKCIQSNIFGKISLLPQLRSKDGGAGMTVAELIKELEKMPQELTVMAAGETAQKVVVEECKGNKYVRIF